MRISDWSSDVCSSDLLLPDPLAAAFRQQRVLVQPILVEGPFHQADAEPVGGWKLALPVLPGKGLDHAVDPVAQPALHETDIHYSPFAAQPPSTKTSLPVTRSEEHTSELQSLMRISYAVFCLNNNITTTRNQ